MPPQELSTPTFDDLLAHLEGRSFLAGAERFGLFSGSGTSGKRILLVDDRTEVIEKFIAMDRDYHAQGQLTAQLSFFRLADHDGARIEDLIRSLKSGSPFDVLFIDGDLGDQGDGTELARHIRTLDGHKYQPIALFTAQASFIAQREAAHANDGMRVIAKFALTGPEAIQSIIIDADDIEVSARDQFWVDARREVLMRLDAGESVKSAAEAFGELLETHFGVCAWYLREIQINGLCAIARAKVDVFSAGDCMPLSATPTFQRKLLEGKGDAEPWTRIDKITSTDAGVKPIMENYRVIAARLSSRIAGDTVALLTAYRRPEVQAFDDRDAMSLHHIAVTLRLALTRRKTSERLGELSKAIGQVQVAAKTENIAALVCDFLQTQINAPLEQAGMKTKTTMRIFHRGNGELHRFGQSNRTLKGLLERDTGIRNIRMPDDCVYTRVVRGGEPRLCPEYERRDGSFLETTNERIESYLTVPLKHDGAVIGAINLEATGKNAYDVERDSPLVLALANVAAAAIIERRAVRFMKDLTQIAYSSITLPSQPQRKIDAFLFDSARALYKLTGYSEMLVFTGADTASPWQVIRGWHGNGTEPEPLPQFRQDSVNNDLLSTWQETFLLKALEKRSQSAAVFHGKGSEGLTDIANGLRDRNRPTEHNIVILPSSNVDRSGRAIILTFEHPRPLPARFDTFLMEFADLFDKIFEASQRDNDFQSYLQRVAIESSISQLLSSTHHAMRSHLSDVATSLRKARDGVLSSDDALAEAEGKLKRARAQFNEQQPVLHAPRFDSCDLRAVWQDLVNEHGDNAFPGTTVEVDGPPVVMLVDSKIIRLILMHLLLNALTHGQDCGATRIELCSSTDECAVCDNGSPLADDVLDGLFELGETVKAGGGGHGLYSARFQARRMGYDLYYERRDSRNCFILKHNRIRGKN